MNLIEQLAEIVGFHASYTGTFGEKVFAKDEARRALLKAMGFALDDASLLNAITKLRQAQWLNPLPVVHIAKFEDEIQIIKISLPITEGVALRWYISAQENTEQGASDVSGEQSLADLQFLDEMKIDNMQYYQFNFVLPKLALGYYQLTIKYGDIIASCPLIFAPKTCYSPQEASANKVWGFTAQLYSLRSHQNWGIGDFSDLAKLVELSAEQQVSTIGLNPLHPLYQNNPAHRSPYSPSTRCFLNPIYIDVTQVENFKDCQLAQDKVASDEFQQLLKQIKISRLVDYPLVAQLKFDVMALLFDDFLLNQTPVQQAMLMQFNEFKVQQGLDLYLFATFDALYEHFNGLDPHSYGWQDWPLAFQQPHTEAVQQFQKTHAKRIDYFCFVQWVAYQQLSAVAQCAQDKKMAIGLYLDLAVGCDGSGFDVWSDKAGYVAGASIGAPPDNMNALGQNWGLTPMNPVALQQQGYQPLIKALRSSMQYAGAIRIDHILGLMRQYWVAPSMRADEGIYISFPWHDILRIIALESRRNQCVVIGEDLGNVPDGFSETIQNAGLLSFKVLFFERWESGLYKRPENFPSQSIVTIATHDTATLSGWWQGRDLEWRQQLNLYPSQAAAEAEHNARAGERQNLIAALNDLQVIDMSKLPPQNPALINSELTVAVQKYLAASPSHIQLIPIEDALELPEQVNIPGTIDEHPNWLQKLPVSLEEFWQANSVTAIAQAMQDVRPKC